MKNVADGICRDQNTHLMFNNHPPPQKKKNCAVYEIMWKTTVESDRP